MTTPTPKTVRSIALRNYYINYANVIGGLDERWREFLLQNTIFGEEQFIKYPNRVETVFELNQKSDIIDQIVRKMDRFDDMYALGSQGVIEWRLKALGGDTPPKFNALFSYEMASRFVDYVESNARKSGALDRQPLIVG